MQASGSVEKTSSQRKRHASKALGWRGLVHGPMREAHSRKREKQRHSHGNRGTTGCLRNGKNRRIEENRWRRGREKKQVVQNR